MKPLLPVKRPLQVIRLGRRWQARTQGGNLVDAGGAVKYYANSAT